MQSADESFKSFVSTTTSKQIPRMAQSWPASCQAAAVSVGGFLAVIVIGMVTHSSSPEVMAAGIGVPILFFGAVTAYEWRLGRQLGIKLTRMHLVGVALGLVIWLMYQTAPGNLMVDPTSAWLCAYVGHPMDHACLVKADAARLRSDIVWWSTGTLIVLFGLFTRRSRSAAWVAPAIAIAGSDLALYFLDVFVRTIQNGFAS